MRTQKSKFAADAPAAGAYEGDEGQEESADSTYSDYMDSSNGVYEGGKKMEGYGDSSHGKKGEHLSAESRRSTCLRICLYLNTFRQ